MSDLIERQAAIDAMAKFVPYAIDDDVTRAYTDGLTDAYNLVCQLPSAQPTGTPLHDSGSDYAHGFADGYKQGLKDAESERVRCKDCKQFRRWIDTDICFCDITEAEMSDNDFCSKAERRTDD